MNKSLNRLLAPFRNQPDSYQQSICYWQTDIHPHLLPGVDDGVSSPEEALTCLQQLLIWEYQPLLAHPERYTCYHSDLKPLAELRKAGSLFQLNWGSMTGRYGRKVQAQAHRLLNNKWIDFMGSDIHRTADIDLFNKLVSSPDYQFIQQQPLRNQKLINELYQP